jgi:hypothetical protein
VPVFDSYLSFLSSVGYSQKSVFGSQVIAFPDLVKYKTFIYIQPLQG